jgi:hypothetical protein
VSPPSEGATRIDGDVIESRSCRPAGRPYEPEPRFNRTKADSNDAAECWQNVPYNADVRDVDGVRTSPKQLEPLRFKDPVAAAVRRVKVWQAYLVAVLIYGVVEKILLPLSQGYFHVSGDLSTWRPDIEALFNGFVSFPMIVAAYVWQAGAVRTLFQGLGRADSFRDRVAFERFVADVRSWLSRDRWWLLSAVLAVAALLWQALWLWDPENPKPVEPWFDAGGPLSRVVALSLSLPFWYFVTQIVIGEIRLASIAWKLWGRLGDSFMLRTHRGDSGLSVLSRHVAILATISAVVLLNLVLGLLLPQIRATDASPDFLLWIIIIWSSYLAVIPALIVALIWPAHRVMANRKDERIHRVNRQIDESFAAVESGSADDATFAATIERLEGMRRLRDWMDSDLSRWPIANILRTVSWSAVVPVALSVLSFLLERAT